MFWIVLGMTLTVVLAAFVVGIVALPARRAGRPVLTTRGGLSVLTTRNTFNNAATSLHRF